MVLKESDKSTLLDAKRTWSALLNPRFRVELNEKLRWAGRNSTTEVIKTLCEFGANPNAVTADKIPILHEVCVIGLVDNAAALLDAGAELNGRDEYLRTALHHCVDAEPDMVRFLIEQGIEVEAEDVDEMTALSEACESAGETACVKTLIDQGADVNTADNTGQRPLHKAVDQIDKLQLLINAGADVNVAEVETLRPNSEGRVGLPGETPLHMAFRLGELDAIELLLTAGADSKAVNDYGETPADAAVSEGQEWVFEALRSRDRYADIEQALKTHASSACTPEL